MPKRLFKNVSISTKMAMMVHITHGIDGRLKGVAILGLMICLTVACSCTRTEKEVEQPGAPPAEAGPAYSKSPSFAEIFPILTRQNRDQARIAHLLMGTFVDWELFVVGVDDIDHRQAIRAAESARVADDERARMREMAKYPQIFIVAPFPESYVGMTMRVGDGFKLFGQFGRVVSEFAPKTKLHVKGRVLLDGGTLKLCVYEIAALR